MPVTLIRQPSLMLCCLLQILMQWRPHSRLQL